MARRKKVRRKKSLPKPKFQKQLFLVWEHDDNDDDEEGYYVVYKDLDGIDDGVVVGTYELRYTGKMKVLRELV